MKAKINPLEMITESTEGINIEPGNIDLHYLKIAASKSKSKDYKGAINNLNKALEISPNDADIYGYMGNAKIMTEDYKGAIEDLNKAIEIDPVYSWAYLLRGIAKMGTMNYAGANIDIDKALDIDSNFAAAYYVRGKLRVTQGNSINWN